MNWNDGYVTDAEYTSHYFAELSPSHLDYLALASGVLPPEREDGRFRYCELGCGNGMTTAVLAACHPQAQFVGIDFMPVHIANARRAAKQGGLSNVQFLEMSFQQACDEPFEPFDYIVAHGVYSWITAENRAEMVEFFRKFLAPGGVVYLSYNCYPGWLPIAPVQKLVSEYARTVRGPSTQRVKAGFDFVKQMLDKGAAALANQPAAKHQIEKAPTQPPNYLAQEYLNEAWYPLYVTDVMRELQAAKLEYVASATPAENDLRFMMPDEMAALVREQPTEELKQLTKDIFTNARFRRDIYTRGGRHLSGLDQRQLLAGQTFALVRAPDAVSYSAEYGGRKIGFDTPYARRTVELLSSGPQSLRTIADELQKMEAKDGLRAALELATILLIGGFATPVAHTGAQVAQMNRSLAERALEDTACNAVATPWGTAAVISPLELATLAVGAPGDSVQQLADKLKVLARKKGRVFNRNNEPLRDEKDIDAFLTEELNKGLKSRWPALNQLGITYG